MVSSPEPLLLHTFMVVWSIFWTGWFMWAHTTWLCCEVSFEHPACGTWDSFSVVESWTEKGVVHAFQPAGLFIPTQSLHRSHETSRQKNSKRGLECESCTTSFLTVKWSTTQCKWYRLSLTRLSAISQKAPHRQLYHYDGGAYTFQTHGTQAICFSTWNRFKMRAIAILRWRITYLSPGKRSSQSRGHDLDVVFRALVKHVHESEKKLSATCAT